MSGTFELLLALAVVLGLSFQRLARRRSHDDAKELRAIRVASWVSATGLVLAGLACLALFFPVDMWIRVAWHHFLESATWKAYHQGRRPIDAMCLVALVLASACMLCGMIGLRQRSMPILTTTVACLGGSLSAASIHLLLWWSRVDVSQVPTDMP